MHPVQLIPLIACVIAAMGATAIVTHDSGQRASRLVALVLACSAWWSLCEVIWNLQTDEQVVLMLIRASSLGWLWLGPLALDFFSEIDGDSRSWMRRIVPAGYAAGAAAIVVYIATPWGVTDAFETSWGWSYQFGPAFPLLYGVTVVCISLIVVNWPRLIAGAAEREKRQARWLLIGILVPLLGASWTDVILPYNGIHVPRIGSTSLLAVGGVVAWSLRRYGYFMMAPGAFAKEIVEALQDGVALLHDDGRIRSCNPGLASMAGVDAVALRNMPIVELLPGLASMPDVDLNDHLVKLEPVQGEPIPVSVSSTVIRDGDGVPVGQVLAVHDLREVTALRDRLVTTGRLAAVGELASGIAHEIANPIASVRSNLVELRGHWETVADALEKIPHESGRGSLVLEGADLIEESIEGVDRVSSIVRDVAAFSHGGRGRTERANVNDMLDAAVGVAALSFSVVIERCYAELPFVRCDSTQLKQALLNLVLNALQAVGDYGNIRLVTQRLGNMVTIRVEDDGPGVSDSDIDRIFDPFFTTRPAGQGIGMGLAQCHRIIRDHGGSIQVESTPGEGARFEIRLPIEPDDEQSPERADASPEADEDESAS